ncbi:MAG: hypothetical protein AAF960_05125 [Bacteroidota bacterium]
MKTFQKGEWRRFKEFLQSPYFNKREDLVAFYSYLMTIAPEFSAKKLRKELIYQKLYPKQPFQDKQIRYLMNYTLRAAEQFLGQEKMERLGARENYTLEALVDRKLEKHAKRYFEGSTLLHHKTHLKSSEYYYSKYKLSDIATTYFSNQDLRKDGGQLAITSSNLDHFYWFKKLKYSCGMLNRQQLFSVEYDLRFAKIIYDYLNAQDQIAEPIISIYLQIFKMLIHPEQEEHFERLRKLIPRSSEEIPNIEKQEIYHYAINYCGSQIKYNNRKEYYANECLNLYLEGIEQEFLFVDGFLSPWDFKNVVKLGFNLKRYDWTEQFIQDYHRKLALEFQKDALNYNLADLAYRKGNYGEAQYHLLLVAYSDVFYTLGAKTMLLKIYYENEEIEPLFSLIASFSIFIRRNKEISENFKETYLNFTTILHQIVRANRKKIPTIIEKINTTETLTNRSWLLKICQEI